MSGKKGIHGGGKKVGRLGKAGMVNKDGLEPENIEPEVPDWKKIRTITAKTSQTEHPEGASKVYGRSNATGLYK